MNGKIKAECIELAAEILKNIELNELPVKNIVLKGLRLCRLLNDEEGIHLFTFESCGYPKTDDGFMTKEAWRISNIAGRRYFEKNKNGENIERSKLELVAELEESSIALLERLKVAADPTSYGDNMTPYMIACSKNAIERGNIINSIKENTRLIGIIKSSFYNYILSIYNKLVYVNVVEDIFTKNRISVNEKLMSICPDAISKFVSVFNNIDSGNSEDWANAVHSCRRIIKDVADKLYPATDVPIVIGKKTIELTDEKYINRLIQFIESRSSSKTYSYVVGTTLESIGERIDSINNAVCKGTHVEVSQNEAERYIVYTYLLLGDIISLLE